MSKQRYFISLGSTAMGALMIFIQRLIDEGIFDRYPSYQFLAIDSDQDAVTRFTTLDNVQRSGRIHGWRLQLSLEDEAVKVFRDWWSCPTVPCSGVGGDRTICIKALKSVKDAIMQYVNFANLATDAEFFVIGSAFGGTSSGIYLNVCEFINEQVRRLKMENPAYGKVILKAFLLMPDNQPNDDGIKNIADYPSMTNMINFFQDVQCKSWQRRLENRWEGFKVPSWPLAENGRFPLNSFEMEYWKFGIEGSTLPWTSIYPVPTLNHSILHTQEYLAEMLFLESVVTIEPLFIPLPGPKGIWWLPGDGTPKEDNCFTGFNFIAFKSGRMPTIKRWFLSELQNSLAVLKAPGTADDSLQKDITATIKNLFTDQMPTAEWEGLLPGTPARSLVDNLLSGLSVAITGFQEFLHFANGLELQLTQLEQNIPGLRTFNSFELLLLIQRKLAERQGLAFELIKKGYENIYDEIALMKGRFKTQHTKLIDLTNSTQRYVNACLLSRKVREFGCQRRLFDTLMAEFKEEFESKLHLLISYARMARTMFVTPTQFSLDVKEFSDVCDSIVDDLEGRLSAHSDNPSVIAAKAYDLRTDPNYAVIRPYINLKPMNVLFDTAYEAKTARDSAHAADFSNYLVQRGMAPAPVIADGVSNSQQRIDEALHKVVQSFNAISDPVSRPPALAHIPDLLSKATYADYDDNIKAMAHTHAPMMVDSTSWSSRPFLIQLGNKPDHFGLTNSDVTDTLGFAKYPGTNVPAGSFLDTPHAVGATAGKFIEMVPSPANAHLFDGTLTAPPTLQGLWFGYYEIANSGRHVLNSLYSSNPMKHSWMAAVNQAVNPRRLMSISDMIKLGLLIRAIDTKAAQTWNDMYPGVGTVQGHSITIYLGGDAAVDQELTLSFTMSDAGFAIRQDNSRCCLESISYDLTKKLVEFIRDEHSFIVAYPHFKIPLSILNAEWNIFSFSTLNIHEDEYQAIDDLYNIIYRKIQIVINISDIQ